MQICFILFQHEAAATLWRESRNEIIRRSFGGISDQRPWMLTSCSLQLNNCSETLNCGLWQSFLFSLMLFLCVLVSKSGFNLFNAASLPSQTALWFMNKFDAATKTVPSVFNCVFYAEVKDKSWCDAAKCVELEGRQFNSMTHCFLLLNFIRSDKILNGLNESTYFSVDGMYVYHISIPSFPRTACVYTSLNI